MFQQYWEWPALYSSVIYGFGYRFKLILHHHLLLQAVPLPALNRLFIICLFCQAVCVNSSSQLSGAIWEDEIVISGFFERKRKHTCPDWNKLQRSDVQISDRLASWGSISGPLKLLEYHSSWLSGDLRGDHNHTTIMPSDASPFDSQCIFFSAGMHVFER